MGFGGSHLKVPCWGRLGLLVPAAGQSECPRPPRGRIFPETGEMWDILREKLFLLHKIMYLQPKCNINKVWTQISLLKNASRRQTEVVIWRFKKLHIHSEWGSCSPLWDQRQEWLQQHVYDPIVLIVITEVNCWKGLTTVWLIKLILTFQIPYKFPLHWTAVWSISAKPGAELNKGNVKGVMHLNF